MNSKKKILKIRSSPIKKKTTKPKITRVPYRGIVHESDNELYTLYFLFELFDLGYITHIERAESFILTNGFINTFSIPSKRKSSGIAKQQTILRPSLYTPEFKIIWNKQIYSKFVWIPESNSKFEKPFIGHQIVNSISGEIEIISFIECKGSGLFDFKNMTRLFGNNQKVVWEKYKIYINLIKPLEFFKRWWCPELFLKTFAGKKRVINFTIKKLKDFINL